MELLSVPSCDRNLRDKLGKTALELAVQRMSRGGGAEYRGVYELLRDGTL